MKTFAQFLVEKGPEFREAGKLEVAKISVDDAHAYAIRELGKDVVDELNFDKNFAKLQQAAKLGKTLRKDMPRIRSDDVAVFKKKLIHGDFDLKDPYAKTTDTRDLFPEKLSGSRAQTWLDAGLKINDGSDTDDVVKVTTDRIALSQLQPIQRQIYFDQIIQMIGRYGIAGLKGFLESTITIASSDNRIIDGHHRYAAGMLIDPSIKVHTLRIDLPISTLLPLALAYGDAIGNKRNK